MAMDDLQAGISGLIDDISGLAQKPLAAALGGAAAGALVGGAVVGLVASNKKARRRSSRKTSSRRKKSRKSGRGRKRKGRYTPHTAGKGKDRSTKRIRYTKNGQPYVITRSGKARFIKKRGARLSHKRKGGRY